MIIIIYITPVSARKLLISYLFLIYLWEPNCFQIKIFSKNILFSARVFEMQLGIFVS